MLPTLLPNNFSINRDNLEKRKNNHVYRTRKVSPHSTISADEPLCYTAVGPELRSTVITAHHKMSQPRSVLLAQAHCECPSSMEGQRPAAGTPLRLKDKPHFSFSRPVLISVSRTKEKVYLPNKVWQLTFLGPGFTDKKGEIRRHLAL